jgi:hypothetical protein
MPTAIPADAAAQLPPARRIDPRGHRFGAGIAAGLLGFAYLAQAPGVVALVLLSIGVSAVFGMRYSVYGLAWRRLARTFGVPPTELEHEYPPRFAQTLGSVALGLALAAFVLGFGPAAWAFAGAVAALQVLLAVTGFCLGCRLYFLRWLVPALVTDVWSRASRQGSTPSTGSAGGRISYR